MATTKKNKRRRNIIIISILAAALLIWGIVATNKPHIQNVATTKAELRTITETVSANGKIQPEIEVKSVRMYRVKLLTCLYMKAIL